MSQVYILWWENESGDWDFVSAHSTHEAAKAAKAEEEDADFGSEHYITPLTLEESK